MAEALEPLKLTGISIVPYLNLVLFADSKSQVLLILQLLNLEISTLSPAQEMRFLVYTINLMLKKIFHPQVKVEKIQLVVKKDPIKPL